MPAAALYLRLIRLQHDSAMLRSVRTSSAMHQHPVPGTMPICRGVHWRRGVSLGGYLACLVIGCIAIPHIYPQAKWYYLFVVYLFVPFFSLANAYAAGLTDQVATSIPLVTVDP